MERLLPSTAHLEVGQEIQLTWHGDASGAPRVLEVRPVGRAAAATVQLERQPDGSWHWRPAEAGLHRIEGRLEGGVHAVLYLEPFPARLGQPAIWLGLALGAALLLLAIRRVRALSVPRT